MSGNFNGRHRPPDAPTPVPVAVQPIAPSPPPCAAQQAINLLHREMGTPCMKFRAGESVQEAVVRFALSRMRRAEEDAHQLWQEKLAKGW